MHVVHVLPGIDTKDGGPPRALRGLAMAQAAIGMEVSVVASYCAGESLAILDELSECGVRTHAVGPCTGPLRRHPTLRPTIRQMLAAPCVVHIHACWEEVQHLAARTARQLNRPYIIRPCGMLDPWCLGQSRLKKRLYLAWRLRKNLNRAAAVHFTTAVERDLAEPVGIRTSKIVEPNGIDLAEFEHLPEPETFRRMYPQLKNRRIVLFHSRVHYKKGLDLLVPAFEKAQLPDTTMVIAGPDANGYRDQVEAMVAEHGIQDRVLFTGMLHDRHRIAALAAADLFVLSSYQENFGLAVVEALAAGTPVVISDQVNIHRQITEARVGGVVPTNVEALSAEITRWLKDEPMRRDAALRARPFVWQRFGWNQIAKRWINHYQRLGANNS